MSAGCYPPKKKKSSKKRFVKVIKIFLKESKTKCPYARERYRNLSIWSLTI